MAGDLHRTMQSGQASTASKSKTGEASKALLRGLLRCLCVPPSVLATVLHSVCVCGCLVAGVFAVVAESVLAVCVAASCMLHAKMAAPAAGEPRSGAKYVAGRPERRGGKKAMRQHKK